MEDLYKNLFDYSMNNPETLLEFEMENGAMFVVKFSHLDIEEEKYYDEFKDSKGLIYQIVKVLRGIDYDYSSIYLEITREKLPFNVKILNDDFVN